MTQPTKRARKQDSTMIQNDARKRDIAAIKKQVKDLADLVGEQRAFIARIFFAAQEFLEGGYRKK